jgi:transcriptional regulator with XRE-family HTH domain
METESTEIPEEILESYPKEERSIVKMLLNMTSTAMKLVSKGAIVSEMVGKAVVRSPERVKMIDEAGAYLRDLREVAGLTRKDVSHTIQLADESFLAAVENGAATLSFELILRMAALFARHDPIPFIIRLTRTYNPEVWQILEKWGMGRLPLHLERERQFINIYRGHDKARKLSDVDFNLVLAFTRSAFEMALDFTTQEDD